MTVRASRGALLFTSRDRRKRLKSGTNRCARDDARRGIQNAESRSQVRASRG